MTDALTGFANCRAFMEFDEQRLNARVSAETVTAFLLFDLYRFAGRSPTASWSLDGRPRAAAARAHTFRQFAEVK